MSSPVARHSLVRRSRSSSEPSHTTTLSGVVIFLISSTHRWTGELNAVMYVSGRGVLRRTSIEALVGGVGEEFGEVLGKDEAVEDLGRFPEPAAASELLELLVADLAVEVAGRRTPVVQLGFVLDPLPELGTGDLGGRRVLHQVEDGGGAVRSEERRVGEGWTPRSGPTRWKTEV